MATVPMTGVRRSTVIILVEIAALVLAGVFVLVQLRPSPKAPVTTTGSQTTATAPSLSPPWTTAQLHQLLDAVKAAEAEGLRASDYQLEALQQAADQDQSGPAVDKLADDVARSLAHDYAAGRIRNRHRFNWYLDYAGPDAAALGTEATAARQSGNLDAWLMGLLPKNRQYLALRDALATTPKDDWQRRDRIKANLERWRWLPRDFGQGDQLYVNLPTYQLDLVRDGNTVASYKAVIGATDMPTPVLSAIVRQVIVNPDWIVPQSIVRKSHLRPGSSSRYEFSTRPDGSLRVRQKPGAGNALGKVKIEFPNKLAIYFHDTPSRSLFGADVRAFSHGCVRVQHIDALATSIVGNDDRLATALAGSKTRSFRTERPLRANIVYLTLVAAADGGITDVGDPYKMDAALALALDPRSEARAAVPDPVPASAPTPISKRTPAPAPAAKRNMTETGAAEPGEDPADTASVTPPAELPANANQD